LIGRKEMAGGEDDQISQSMAAENSIPILDRIGMRRIAEWNGGKNKAVGQLNLR
jgi:hypothetical protein